MRVILFSLPSKISASSILSRPALVNSPSLVTKIVLSMSFRVIALFESVFWTKFNHLNLILDLAYQKHHIRNPYLINLSLIKSILSWDSLEIMILGSTFIPFQLNLKFELNLMILLIDFNDSLEYCGYIDIGCNYLFIISLQYRYFAMWHETDNWAYEICYLQL